MNKQLDINVISRLIHKQLICQLPYAKDILNIGAGNGDFAMEYPYISSKITFLDKKDSEDDEFSYCIKRYTAPRFTHIEGDCTAMPMLEDESFDMVIFTEVIEHLTDNQIEKTMLEIKRVLKPNGKFILSTPNIIVRKQVGKYMANKFHIKEYTNIELTTLLTSYGFKIEKNVGILSIKNNVISAIINIVPEEGYLLWVESIKNESIRKKIR